MPYNPLIPAMIAANGIATAAAIPALAPRIAGRRSADGKISCRWLSAPPPCSHAAPSALRSAVARRTPAASRRPDAAENAQRRRFDAFRAGEARRRPNRALRPHRARRERLLVCAERPPEAPLHLQCRSRRPLSRRQGRDHHPRPRAVARQPARTRAYRISIEPDGETAKVATENVSMTESRGQGNDGRRRALVARRTRLRRQFDGGLVARRSTSPGQARGKKASKESGAESKSGAATRQSRDP